MILSFIKAGGESLLIQHIVMWKFKDSAHGKSKAEHMEWMRSHLLALPPLIPQLKKMKIEFDASGNHSNYDAVLLTVFDDFDALQSYKVCPDQFPSVVSSCSCFCHTS